MENALKEFLAERGLSLCQSLGKGRSSHIFLVKGAKGKAFVAKAERPDSTRFKMAEREVQNLAKANAIGIGPKLAAFDLQKRVILMEFVEGKTLSEWLFANHSKEEVLCLAKELIGQARELDGIGLDHGQLAGQGKNILVRKNTPVIIDFEKASSSRKCHNLRVMESFLFKNPKSAIAGRVRKILGKKEASRLSS